MSNDYTKIVINGAYGGFSLTPAVTRRYLRLAQIEYSEIVDNQGYTRFIVNGVDFYFDGNNYEKRSEPCLVKAIETGPLHDSYLFIVPLIKGTKYRIKETVDGYETIETIDEIKWLTA